MAAELVFSTLAAGEGADQVRRLKASSGGGLVAFGGVHTARSLVAADLVDEYWLKFNPAIVGRGGSMFSDVVERRALTLRSARSFPSGGVAAIYPKNRRSGDACWERGAAQLPPSHPPAMANPGLKHVEPSWIETTGG